MSIRLSSRIALATMVVAVPLALSACGGGDESSTSAGASGASGASGAAGAAGGGNAQSVDIKETEFKLTPDTVNVKPGTVEFHATNDGSTTHSLEVEGPNGDEELETDLQPGDEGTLSVDLSKPGTYEMYCPIDDHRDQGMEGKVVVK